MSSVLLVQTRCTVIGAAMAQSVWLVDCYLAGPGFEFLPSQEIFFFFLPETVKADPVVHPALGVPLPSSAEVKNE